MQISYKGIQLLKNLEGFRRDAYDDGGGVWTIGYGTIAIDGQAVKKGDLITEKIAEEAMVKDLAWAQTAVNKLVKVKLTQNMFDALVSFVYNIGEEAFYKSTLLRVLNEGNYLEASKQFKRWNQDNGKVVQGLVNRRVKEEELFRSA